MVRKLFLLLVLACPAAWATSVVPTTFEQLVADSSAVFRGEVTGVQCAWRSEPSRHLVTLVTFRVDRLLKGRLPAEVTLEFLGGEMSGHRMELVGMPHFSPGQHAVYFVENATDRVCPLLRLRHGRYPVKTDPATGEQRIVRDDGSPLQTPADVNAPLAETRSTHSVSLSSALTVVDFERRVLAETARSTAQQDRVR